MKMNKKERIIYIILTLLMYIGYVMMFFDLFKIGIHILAISGIVFIILLMKIMKYGTNS